MTQDVDTTVMYLWMVL